MTATVFLSYTSDDAEAAQRLADALQRAGLEVWLDQSDLRGGDVWDAKIRRQIKDCTLFIPLISANTERRGEGYFRLEWKLAIERSHLMAEDQAFLVPVVIDATAEAGARVPEKFREVQWTRLPQGQVGPEFVERVKRLLGQASTTGPRSAEPLSPASPASVTHSTSRQTGRRIPWVPVALVVLVLAAGGLWLTFHRVTHRDTAIAGPAASAGPHSAKPLSIIVLPFLNRTSEPQKGYIADGITSSITSDLSRIEQAYVVPGPTAYAYKDRALSVRQVALDAHVRFVLSGSVQGSATHLRINVELFDGPTETQLWSHVFDGEDTDLLTLQDRVTTRVGNSLNHEMVIAAAWDTQSLARHPESVDLLLQARALKLGPESVQSSRAREEIYRKLVEREPDNVSAITGLAYTISTAAVLGFYSPHTPTRQAQMIDEAHALAERASRSGYRHPDLDYVFGWTALFHGDVQVARRYFQAIADHVPKSVDSFNNLGCAAYADVEPLQALAYFKQASDLDPDREIDYVLVNIAIAYLQAKDYARAVEAVDRALVASPQFESAFAIAALAHALNGDAVEATRWADKARSAQITIVDATGVSRGSPRYEQWLQTVIMPVWRKLGLAETDGRP